MSSNRNPEGPRPNIEGGIFVQGHAPQGVHDVINAVRGLIRILHFLGFTNIPPARLPVEIRQNPPDIVETKLTLAPNISVETIKEITHRAVLAFLFILLAGIGAGAAGGYECASANNQKQPSCEEKLPDAKSMTE